MINIPTFTAKKTLAAKKRGGSPTALLEYTARGLDAPRRRATLKTPEYINIVKRDNFLQLKVVV